MKSLLRLASPAAPLAILTILAFAASPHSTAHTPAAQLAPQNAVHYHLSYRAPADPLVHISITLNDPVPAPLALVMPRSYPGGYNRVTYDFFVAAVQAFSPEHKPLPIERDPDGPRWQIGHHGDPVATIDYEVDIARMEHDLVSAVDSSKIRSTYAGLLGYSIFAFLDGFESHPVSLEILAPSQWPILSTLDPQIPLATDRLAVLAPDYDHLADSQVLMGPGFHAARLDGAVPLFMAGYTEGEADLDAESQLARRALDRVAAYFTDKSVAPLPHYTVQLELLTPLPGHDYDFSQEHFDSGTFSLSTERAVTSKSPQRLKDSALFNFAHHMAHSWIPKRAYGTGYMPFTWEITPVIDTVWFNEGFAQFAAMDALAAAMPPADAAAFRAARLDRWRGILRDAPPLIQRMGLLELSREASFLYSDDFRLGMNSFSRGALIAAEMDNSIRAATHNSKSLRDALCYLFAWTDHNHRAFTLDEFPALLATGSGADAAALRSILTRWLAPPIP
jgi:predicted metalloprotease with PDZ domain